MLANGDWASALWLQQHSGILGLPKSPGKVIVSNVSEVDIAVAIFPAKSNVLQVIYCCPLKFHIGQPTTWSSTWVKFQGSSHTVFWDGEDPVLPVRVVVHPQSLWHELRQQAMRNVRLTLVPGLRLYARPLASGMWRSLMFALLSPLPTGGQPCTPSDPDPLWWWSGGMTIYICRMRKSETFFEMFTRRFAVNLPGSRPSWICTIVKPSTHRTRENFSSVHPDPYSLYIPTW